MSEYTTVFIIGRERRRGKVKVTLSGPLRYMTDGSNSVGKQTLCDMKSSTFATELLLSEVHIVDIKRMTHCVACVLIHVVVLLL